METLRLVSVFILLASVYSKVLVGFEENNINVDDRDDVNAEEIKDLLEYNIENENHHLNREVQGDMMLTDKQREAMKNGNANDRSLAFSNWRTGTGSFVKIPYVINETNYSEDNLQIIKGAMDQYKEKTCIRFVPRTSEADYLHIYKGSGCWSYVGKIGGKQEVSLGDGCVYKEGTPIHEFMHAIGYLHEQGRKDRDKYVKINMDNVKKGRGNNFELCENCDLQGLKYDIGSVMHYHSMAFSKNGKPTIEALGANSGKQLGQRNGFSALDIEGINKVYCSPPTTPAPATTPATPVCQNQFPDGYNCRWTCKKWEVNGYCDYDFSTSPRCGINDGKVNEYCKSSCKTCGGLRNEGKECWTASCKGQGPCAFCGNGLCCKKNFKDTTKGCDGSIGGDRNHQCVAKPDE